MIPFDHRSTPPVVMRAERVTKTFGRLRALNDVSFSVRGGEILGLIGPNGSGKTTLFECLAGVLPADSGTVFDNTGPLDSSNRSSLLFYMPDAIAPWAEQSLTWALDFTLGFFGGGVHMRRDIGNDMRDDVVQQFDLKPLLNSRIGTLSKGQRKRALLAIGLLTPQPVFLADEPFDGLDLRQTRDAANALRDYAAAGRTLCLSIHQIKDAERVCDRFVLLSGGEVRGEGTLGELRAAAASVSGSPPQDLEEVFLALT